MNVRAETAVVYHSGRRRYFSLHNACRDAAKQKFYERYPPDPEDMPDESHFQCCVAKLTRWYERKFRKENRFDGKVIKRNG